MPFRDAVDVFVSVASTIMLSDELCPRHACRRIHHCLTIPQVDRCRHSKHEEVRRIAHCLALLEDDHLLLPRKAAWTWFVNGLSMPKALAHCSTYDVIGSFKPLPIGQEQ